MPRSQWRTFSIRVSPRRAVGVQAQFPLSDEEWDIFLAGLLNLRNGQFLGDGGDIASVPVSARMVRKLQENREAGS